MAKYKLNEAGVIDTETNSSIPNAEGNRHWREYQEWLAAGNTPDPADPPPEPPGKGEIVDAELESNPVLAALVDALDAGDFTPGNSAGRAAIKAALVSRMP